MAIGGLGFVILALSQHAWAFVAGIAVFAIGEMTAHPKYYSYVGLVAPADRKAVYMGYAFLYGVFGALLGANVGAFLYERILTPVAPAAAAVGVLPPGAPGAIRFFWLLFVAVDVVAVAGLTENTPGTRRRARSIMYVVYSLVALLGAYFLFAATTATPTDYKTVVQAVIFLALGAGGLLMNRGR
jgi:MFS family permease